MSELPNGPADIAAGITQALADIRRHWKGTENPPRRSLSGGARSVPASRFPTSVDAISVRAETTRDLAFWVHVIVDEHPASLDEWDTIDCTDVHRMCRFLTEQASWASKWEHGNRMWGELFERAQDVRNIAAPRVRDTMPIGECECGSTVRAKAHDPGNIKCKGCGTVDTLDGWIIRIVGNEPLVTAHQLVPLLHKRMGLVVSPATLRTWTRRHVIYPAGTDVAGRTLYDRKAVYLALANRDDRKDAS